MYLLIVFTCFFRCDIAYHENSDAVALICPCFDENIECSGVKKERYCRVLPKHCRLPGFFFRFPELQYFKDEKVRRTMSDILFVYAKQHPEIAYRQVVVLLIFNYSFCLQESLFLKFVL